MHYRRRLTVLTLIALAWLDLFSRASAAGPAVNVKYSFASGWSPNAGLVVGANSNFYGVTATGGASNYGGIYEVTSKFELTNVIWLEGANGATPQAPLIQGADGNFYGTASSGGVRNNGTVFEFTPKGQIKVLASFSNTDGSTPLGPLLEGTNGWLYGTTFNGGSNNSGTIFRIPLGGGALTNVYSFGGSSGANPAAGLIQGSDGNLYGTTEYGGASGFGTVFKMSYKGALTNLASFGNNNGAYPGGLAKDATGNLYGATISGGANVAGTIFKISRSTLSTLFTFGVNNGASPNSPLTLANSGSFYGMTKEGGEFNAGTIFQLNTQGDLTVLASFAGTNGAAPLSGLVEGRDGNYYGTTSQGGTNDAGEIYQLGAISPSILTPPESQSWVSNKTAMFSVTAGGTQPLSYQWQFDGTNAVNDLPGQTNASLEVTNQQLTTSGTYTVLVSNAFGAVSASAVLSVPTPTVAIVSPASGARTNSIVIEGTAKAFASVAEVDYWITNVNAGNTLTTTINSGLAGLSALGTTNQWAINNALLLPGTNYVTVQSVDSLGNPSAPATREFFYIAQSDFTLLKNGPGAVSGSASVAGNPRPTNGAMLNIGEGYTLTAAPSNHFVFSNWTSSTGFISNASTLHFIMESNLTLTANFSTNLFIGAAGTYNGLFYSTNEVTEQTAGMLKNLTVTSKGSFTGDLLLGGATDRLSGSFNLSGYASNEVNRTTAKGGPVTVEMTLDWTSGEINGSVSGSNVVAWDSLLEAEKSAASSSSAQSTVLLASGTNATGEIPTGEGYMLITNHHGSVTLSGALADGTAISQSVPLGVSNEVPVFASLYSNTGLLLGWLGFSNGTFEAETNMVWLKPAAHSGLYTNGFTNLLSGSGSAWTKPPANYLTNGSLEIFNTTLGLKFVVSITNSTLLKEPGSLLTNSLTGAFSPKTGLLKISFGNGAGKDTTTGYAAILGDLTNGGGYFVTKTNTGTIILNP